MVADAIVGHSTTVEPAVCYGYLGTSHKCPDYQGVPQVSLYDKLHHLGP